MNAIVEQNEKANQETSCHDRERQCPPIGKIVPDTEDHQVPQSSIRDHRIGELPNRLAATGTTIGRECRARVEGAVDAWHPSRASSLQLTFRNLQIPEYSPYTVDFAGRKIAGGTMDLDLDYTVESRQLDGQNNLVLHDLKLGEKMASSDAMDLPLDLAIALLQDSDGVIDLNLPVTGNVGDPEFDFDQVIRRSGIGRSGLSQSPGRTGHHRTIHYRR